MSRVRLLGQKKAKRGVMSPQGWDSLMRQVIDRAEALSDRRLEGFKLALQEGRSEATLRKMGIICDTDVTREFPIPEET